MHIVMFGLKGIPSLGGVETVAEELGSRLTKRGHRIDVYVRSRYSPRDIKNYKGINLIHLPSISSKNLDAITHSFLSLFHSISRKPDLIHIHSIGSSVYSFIPRLFGIPTIVQSHGLDWQRAKWGYFAKKYLHLSDYFSCHFPTALTVVSKKMQKYYLQKYKKKSIYIPNGVTKVDQVPPQLINELGLEKDKYILFASRLVPEKGCHYLIEAFNNLQEQTYKLVIAGEGSYGDSYEKKIKNFKSENIVFLGYVTGKLKEELLSNCYIYVLPSEIEGLSTGLLEAMSYGNCVLASNIEENLEVIEDSGVSFQNKSVQNLTEKIEYLIRNKHIVEEYRKKAKIEISNRYNWEKVTDDFECLYSSLIK